MASVTTTHTMTENAVEESTYIIPIAAFYDEDDTAITPNAITWSLHDGYDDVVNSRNAVVATAATAIDIVLSGADLAVPDAGQPARYVTIEYTYDSDAGSDLPGKHQVAFNIIGFPTV